MTSPLPVPAGREPNDLIGLDPLHPEHEESRSVAFRLVLWFSAPQVAVGSQLISCAICTIASAGPIVPLAAAITPLGPPRIYLATGGPNALKRRMSLRPAIRLGVCLCKRETQLRTSLRSFVSTSLLRMGDITSTLQSVDGLLVAQPGHSHEQAIDKRELGDATDHRTGA